MALLREMKSTIREFMNNKDFKLAKPSYFISRKCKHYLFFETNNRLLYRSCFFDIYGQSVLLTVNDRLNNKIKSFTLELSIFLEMEFSSITEFDYVFNSLYSQIVDIDDTEFDDF